jgi:hypothetical protein
MTAHRRKWRLPVLVAGMALAVVYWLPVRRRFSRWGTTPEELARVMLGDALMLHPRRRRRMRSRSMRLPRTSGRGSCRSETTVAACTATTGSTGSSASSIVRARLASFPSSSSSPWVTRSSSDGKSSAWLTRTASRTRSAPTGSPHGVGMAVRPVSTRAGAFALVSFAADYLELPSWVPKVALGLAAVVLLAAVATSPPIRALAKTGLRRRRANGQYLAVATPLSSLLRRRSGMATDSETEAHRDKLRKEGRDDDTFLTRFMARARTKTRPWKSYTSSIAVPR